jgi:hypothetical protein
MLTASTVTLCQAVNKKDESSLSDTASTVSSDTLGLYKRKKTLLRCVAQLETNWLAEYLGLTE